MGLDYYALLGVKRDANDDEIKRVSDGLMVGPVLQLSAVPRLLSLETQLLMFTDDQACNIHLRQLSPQPAATWMCYDVFPLCYRRHIAKQL